jgi:hypothetical protein
VPYVITLTDSFDRSEWTMPVYGPVRAKSGEAAVDVELFIERGGWVSGDVYDAATAEPVAGVSVLAESGPRFYTLVAKAITGEDGLYGFRLPTGLSKLRTRTVPDGYAPNRREEKIEIKTQGKKIDPIDFQLSRKETPKETDGETTDVPDTMVRGIVVLTDGTPAEGVLVSIHNKSEDRHVKTVYTDVRALRRNRSLRAEQPGPGFQQRHADGLRQRQVAAGLPDRLQWRNPRGAIGARGRGCPPAEIDGASAYADSEGLPET